MQKVYIETEKDVVEMSIDEFSRWMCLVEAIDIIEKKAHDLGVSTKDILTASPIEEYIHGSNGVRKTQGRYHSMRHDVICELELGNL